jgi:hypothetical protein
MGQDAATLLERVWDEEIQSPAEKPNFARIVKDAQNNIRGALMALESRLMEV